MTKKTLDPVKYELFYNKLAMDLDEAKEVVRYLSGSTITKEAGEVVQAFFNLKGEAVGMACGILIHIGAATRCIHYALNEGYDKPGIGIYDGDMFINNDAYIGGAHVPDTAVVAPVFHKGKLVGWTAGLSHTSEVGAIEPGGMCYAATEAIHEGLHMPLIKLIEKSQMRRDIFNMILRSTRDPRAMELDIRARIAGCERMYRKINELIDMYGLDFFNRATRQMVKDVDIEAREQIKKLKPGVYSCRVFNDTVGIKGDKPAVIQIQTEITEEGTINITAPVVSPQCDGYNNTYIAGVQSFTMCTLLQTLFYNMRWNGGIMRVASVDFPPHSRLNADPDRAIGQSVTSVMSTYTGALSYCITQACYVSGKLEEVEAPYNGGPVSPPLAGIDREGVLRVQVMVALDACGSGGRLNKDGKDTAIIGHGNPWNYVPDTEGEEMVIPMLRLSAYQLPDSSGPGKFRGGVGIQVIVLFPHKGKNCALIGQGSGSRMPAGQGLWGGYPASRVFRVHCKDTDMAKRIKEGLPLPHTLEELTTNVKSTYQIYPVGYKSVPFNPGDILASNSHGGCGLGDPIERDPELIVQDVQKMTASLEVSEKIYCVSIDPETLKVDYEKTRKLREKKRKDRLNKGIPVKDYIKLMVEKRNKRELNEIALKFMDETAGFSPVYKKQLEDEEKILKDNIKPIGKVKVVRDILSLNPYIKIVEDDKKRKVSVCSVCGFAYCEASKNHKHYSLVFERDPADIHGSLAGYPSDWCIYREYYCPGCGTQIEVEATVPGTPIIQTVKLNKIE
jgi:N-methylhydantoinase B